MEWMLGPVSVERTDEALAQAAREGCRDSYAVLAHRYRALAYAYAVARLRSREDAEDLIQDAFVAAYRRLDQFRGRGCWGAWLMRIVRNLCTDAERRRRSRASEPMDEEWLDDAPGPDAQVLDSDTKVRVIRAVRQLPEQFRVPLVLHYWARLTYREVALALGLRESTAIGRVAVALRRLRRELAREEKP
jgi:RNA polymerase sigma-70 factor, ECF subfamily